MKFWNNFLLPVLIHVTGLVLVMLLFIFVFGPIVAKMEEKAATNGNGSTADPNIASG